MEDTSTHKDDTPKTLLIHYLKSPLFRTIHADGLFGGLTPHQNIHMTFWTERAPIPQVIEHVINPDGSLGEEILEARIGKKGLVREIDIDVVFDLSTAIAIRKWLDQKIALLENAISEHPKPGQ